MFVSATLVIFTFTAVGRVGSENYMKGGKAVLSPGPVSGPITSVTWKHGADIAVERYGQETTEYRDFKGRCEVDKTTGALTISNLTLTDSGRYTAEINSRIMKTTEIRVITAVPKPTISTRCNPEVTQCTLTCNASVTDDMGIITYFWKTGDRQIPESSSNQLNIAKDDSEFVEKMIICQLENPVSSERSDDMNPFTNGSSVDGIKAAAVIPLLIVLLIVAASVGFVCWHKRRSGNAHESWREYFAHFDPRNCLCRGRKNQQTPEQKAETEKFFTENANRAAIKYSELNETHSQDQNPGPSSTGNEAEMPNNTSERLNDPGSDQTPAKLTEPSSETTTSPENQEDSNQDQQGPVPKGTNNEAEMPNNISERLNDPGSDHTHAEPTEPSSETKMAAVAPNAEEQPDQHPQQEDETRED